MKLIECERYACRLTLEACQIRWRKAGKGSRDFGYMLKRGRSAAQACRGCAQGAERARGGVA